MSRPHNLLLIDAIGPFFRHCKRKRINWSKIPFADLENDAGLRADRVGSVPDDFRRFARTVKQLGYTAVTLDDVAHLAPCALYSDRVNAKISAYRELFRELFAIAEEEGLQVFLTMDVMFYTPELRRALGRDCHKAAGWLHAALDQLFVDFPLIAGIVMRCGEKDGVDVRGDFRSELILRRPSQARSLLKHLLPLFERHNRLLIFRTWSVGAHAIGDLMWNERTFHRVFQGLDSPALVISMKYGESDFFRYLPLNRLFFASRHKKIIEFQARREYEGFGAYPSFVGWDVQRLLEELQSAPNVIGASVWCQTGGWGKLRQLTFLRNSSKWVELNTHVIARLWRGDRCEEAITAYTLEHLPDTQPAAMIEFLQLSEVVIKELLYVREFAERRLFFRRLRLPPQLYVFWDRVIVSHTMKRVMSQLVNDPETAVREGREALDKLREMVRLAEVHGIPRKGLKLQLATFEILAAARDYFFSPHDEELIERIKTLKADYKKRFKRNYSIVLNFDPAPIHKFQIRWLLALMLRDRSRYRLLDELITLRGLSWAYPFVRGVGQRLAPKFASKQAMGIDVIFK